MPSVNDSLPPARSSGAHLPGLDGLRGIAILVVLLHHFVTPNYPQGIPGGFHGTAVKVVYRLCDVGWWGVDLFFVLSGFLITGVLLDARGRAHYFRNFYARRSLRIFPLYYGVLLMLFVVLPLLARIPPLHDALQRSGTYTFSQSVAFKQAWLWLYGTNLKTALDATGWTFGYLTHFWSLSVEEHFYLVWPLVVFCCQPRTLIRVCLGVAAASLVARVVCLTAGMAPAYIFVLTPCRLDGLALGGLVAAWSRLPGGWAELTLIARRTLKWVGPVTLLALLTLNRFGAFMILAGHALLAVTWAAALPFAASAGGPGNRFPRLGRWLCAPGLRTLGKYSYGIYVLHPFVLEPVDQFARSAAVRHVLGTSYEAYALTRTSLAFGGAFALAVLSWHCYEKHFLKLKAFFQNARVTKPSTNQSESSAPSPATASTLRVGSPVRDLPAISP